MSPRSTETEVLAQELDSVGNKLRALEARLAEVEKIIEGLEAAALTTVSYTHLTLPTILLV